VPRLIAVLTLVLAACGGPGTFDGTFTGSYEGEPVALTLEVDGRGVAGTMRRGGVEAVVSGSVDRNRIKGTVRQPEMGVEVPFEATLAGDRIDWTYTYVRSGGKVSLTLTRAKGPAAEGPIDPQLVGRWLGTDGAANCVLNADGTFERGTDRGRWKAEGAILHTRATGAGWAIWGRYVLSGGDLTIYDRKGRKQVWKRE
jgi:hypothetical protein